MSYIKFSVFVFIIVPSSNSIRQNFIADAVRHAKARDGLSALVVPFRRDSSAYRVISDLEVTDLLRKMRLEYNV